MPKTENVTVIEVGFRVALRLESLPRDMRWWRGLWRTGQWLKPKPPKSTGTSPKIESPNSSNSRMVVRCGGSTLTLAPTG